MEGPLLAELGSCSVADLAAFARAVSEAHDVATARRILVTRTAELLDASASALTHPVRPHGVTFVATSGDVAEQMRRIARRTRDGICWQVHASGAAVVAVDLSSDDRWPGYRREVVTQLPVRSAVGLPLHFANQLIGALMVYAEEPGHFTESRLADALLLGEHAALALAHATERANAANLELALRTSRDIAIAIGIIMDRTHVTEQEAFDQLRRLSQTWHMKVRDIAKDIAFSGALPVGGNA